MPAQDAVIRLVIVEDRLEDAEQIISHLRNGGIAVRPQRPESDEELASMINSGNVDIVLHPMEARYIPVARSIELATATGKDIPVLVLLNVIDEPSVLAAIALGARDVCSKNKAEHLRFAVKNEFSSLSARRGLRLLEASLRETERRCDALIASSRDPIAYVHEGMHIRANEAYLEMFGFESFEDIEGLSVLDLIAASSSTEFKELLKKIKKGEAPPKEVSLKAVRSDGEQFEAVMEFTPASYEGEHCLQIVFRQQTIDAEMVKELDSLRTRDPVTGAFNRTHLMTEIEAYVGKAAAGKGHQSFLLVDPDNYDAQIAAVGLSHADEFLKAMHARIESQLGDHAIIARFSDHTFGVLLTHHDHKATKEMAEKLRESFDGHVLDIADRTLNITVSIGGVQIGEKIASVPQVMGKTNQCLQSAVGVGGNRCEIFDPAARERAEEERIQAWVARIKEALVKDEFMLYFQPIISLKGEPGESYEVYIRMKGINNDIVEPDTFFDIAEEHGLLDDIDRWVVGRAIALLSERKKAGHDTSLFVKITPAAVTEGSMESFIRDQLRAHGITGEKLVLQLPESKIFTHLRAIQSFQQAMYAEGCRICLEQFGTSLNSVQMMQHVKPDIVKLDRSFVSEMSKNPDMLKKVKEMTSEASKLDKITIAEHVSDASAMTSLFSMGVDYVEGNFLAPPSDKMNYDFSA
jgi:multidomain signaling protein FimX